MKFCLGDKNNAENFALLANKVTTYDARLATAVDMQNTKYVFTKTLTRKYVHISNPAWPIGLGLLTIDWIFPSTQMAFSTNLGPYLPEDIVGYWLLPSFLTAELLFSGLLEICLPKAKPTEDNVTSFKQITSDIFLFARAGLSLTTHIMLTIIWINKFITNSNYQYDKKICNDNCMQYDYMPNYGGYQCAVCPDWNFIEPSKVFKSQDCLDGLMERVKKPDKVLKYLDRIVANADFTRVDLSGIDWSEWTLDQFELYFEKIAKHTKKIDELILARDASNASFEDDGKLSYLFDKFLAKVEVNTLNVNYWRMGLGFAKQLMNGAINAKVKHLLAAGNDFGDDGVTTASDYLNATIFESFDVGYNGASNTGLKNIAYSQPVTLLSLNVAGNLHDVKGGLIPYFNITQGSGLTSFNTSDVNLSQGDLSPVGKYVSNSLIEIFDASRTQINNEQVCGFMQYGTQGPLDQVWLGYNQITGDGAECAFNYSIGSNVTNIKLNGNQITDPDLPRIKKHINQTKVNTVGLANISANAGAMINFLDELEKNRGYSIDVSNNPYSPEFGKALAKIIEKNPHKFTELNLSNTQVGDQGAKPILLIKKSGLIKLVLNDNELSDGILDTAANLPSDSELIYLYLDGNSFKAGIGANVAPMLLTPSPKKEVMSAEKITQLEAKKIREAKPATNLKKLSLFHKHFNDASEWAWERLHGIDVDYSSNRGLNSPSNISASIYLGFATAPYIAPGAIILLLVCVAFQVGHRVRQQKTKTHNKFAC